MDGKQGHHARGRQVVVVGPGGGRKSKLKEKIWFLKTRVASLQSNTEALTLPRQVGH